MLIFIAPLSFYVQASIRALSRRFEIQSANRDRIFFDPQGRPHPAIANVGIFTSNRRSDVRRRNPARARPPRFILSRAL
jgi:hypothetical protein